MNDIFKLLEPIMAVLIGSRQNLAERTLRIPAEVLNQLREILRLLAQLMGSLILFCLGMSYFIDRLLDQLDSGGFHFTPSLVFLTLFMAACLASLLHATQKSVWTSIFEKTPEPPPAANPLSGNGPLETAISLYILDVVKEREAKRESTTPPARTD